MLVSEPSQGSLRASGKALTDCHQLLPCRTLAPDLKEPLHGSSSETQAPACRLFRITKAVQLYLHARHTVIAPWHRTSHLCMVRSASEGKTIIFGVLHGLHI